MANLIFKLDYSDKSNPNPNVFQPLDELYLTQFYEPAITQASIEKPLS